MALSLSRFAPSPLPIPSSSSRIKPIITNHLTTPTPIFTTPKLTTKHHRISIIPKSTEENQQPNPQQSDEDEQQQQTQLGTEIKKAMMETQDINAKDDGGFWGGVADEIGKIEWPAFNKVVGTTGVVLGVIAGSSVVLLTVNAVLAELSDRVFLGRGVQDFFG